MLAPALTRVSRPLSSTLSPGRAALTIRTFSSPTNPPIHPLPPFTSTTAAQKVKAAQDKWNTCDPELVAPAYTPKSEWRNRDEFLHGREEIKDFLQRKWTKEKNYRLRKELFGFSGNKIAVEFWYEYSETEDPSSQWHRTYGIEHWVFHNDGRMKSRQMSGNTIPIKSEERWFKDGVDVNEVEIPRGHVSLIDH